MRRITIILIFGFVFISAGSSQVALVLKDNTNGREWPIGKGKTLSVTGNFIKDEFKPFNLTGSLISFTDNSLTLRSELWKKDTTILFEDIDQVRVKQSLAGNGTGILLLSLGLPGIILAPVAGIEENAPYNWTSAIATFGFSMITSAAGYLILQPYESSYTLSGTCHSRLEKYLRNKNGTYYFSAGYGFGPSYGGIGFRAQTRIGGISGVGFHIGGGWNFLYGSADTTQQVSLDDAFSVLAGVKFFPYRGWYMDVQFGQFGKIATVSYEEDKMIIHHIDKPYGFVFTFGGDWFWGRHLGLNLGFGAALDLTAPESSNMFPVFDMGFIIKL